MLKQVHLGAIICPCCNELIDTFDSERVIIYYSHCKGQDCIEKIGGEVNEG